jgi:anhydro-N-acetylmuramic acid kinase
VSKPLTAIGLMSGTSLDGIDVALIRTDGANLLERGPSATIAYDHIQRTLLRQALAQATSIKDRGDRPGAVGEAETALTRWHADAVLACLHNWHLKPSEIDVIGFHGQTVLHRPDHHLTIQIGDASALAETVGVTVVHDLRAADVAAGGQGAPLVPVYHQALSHQLNQNAVAFVNIGGVGNVTYCGKDGELIAFDTGPGNALIDDWMLRHTGQASPSFWVIATSNVPARNPSTATVSQTLHWMDLPQMMAPQHSPRSPPAA